MNPNTGETSGMQLPPPIMEQPAGGAVSGETTPVAPERAPAAAERGSQPAAAAPPLAVLPLPPALPAQQPAQGVTGAVGAGSTAAMPSDRDLIAKEWVMKAKEIVEHNRDDPHKQSEELTMFKADYLQKNYGKQIKLST